MTSEIIGMHAVRGVKVGSRIDVLAIEKSAGPVYEALDTDDGWTLDEARARKEKNKPVLYSRKGTEGKAGDPSHVNHGNIVPSIDAKAGGVSIDSAMQIVVLSFGALRKFQFPVDHTGTTIDAARRTTVETAARTALAAMGIAALVLAYEGDYDLRSRCVLRPTSPLTFELMRRGVAEGETVTINRTAAIQLLHDAAEAATKAGLGWITDEVSLAPSERLVSLITRSRELGVDAALDSTTPESN
jgi:CRISPR-associated protein Csb1